jgi:hypothetical protein
MGLVSGKAISAEQNYEIETLKKSIKEIIYEKTPFDKIESIHVEIKMKESYKKSENIDFSTVKLFVEEIIKK